MTFDPRITPARPDLAAKHLKGQVTADRYVAGKVREIVEPHTPVRKAPAADAPLETEALIGDRVTVYETTGKGWAWGQIESDGYVGWLPARALGKAGAAPTHKVSALRTLVFPLPSIKAPPRMGLPLGARIAVDRMQDGFAVTAAGGFVPAQHVTPVDKAEWDFVTVAEKFLGAPYLWGGKTSLGIDCSGLVQVALTAGGFACPRDSDMQEQALGTPVEPMRWLNEPKRGDLLFWKGHVAIVQDRRTLIHANAFHMAVALEPIMEAIPRIRSAGSEVTSVRRVLATED